MENLRGITENALDGFRILRPAWDDLRFPATGLNPPGAVSDPSVDTEDGLLVFSATATNMIAGLAQMPHAWIIGSALRPHIHWMPSTANAGNVVWRLEYRLISFGATLPVAWTTENVTSATSGTANRHQVTQFSEIGMAGQPLSACISWRISRIGGDAADTFTGQAKLLEVDFHYQKDGLGSDEERTKVGLDG